MRVVGMFLGNLLSEVRALWLFVHPTAVPDGYEIKLQWKADKIW